MHKLKPKANDLDIVIGRRIEIARKQRGYTQEKLADLLGLSYQQIQKYESGMNRVSASRLKEIASILDKSFYFFFAEALPIERLQDMSFAQLEENYDLFDAMMNLLPKHIRVAMIVILLSLLDKNKKPRPEAA